MCIRAQGIDNNNGGVGKVRWACVISDNDGGFIRGRGIHNAPKGLETTTEAAGDRRRAQGIYDDNGSFGGGRRA